MKPLVLYRLAGAILAVVLVTSCTMSGAPPSTDLKEVDLVGTWVARYSPSRIDRLEIRGDGTFKQTYQDRSSDNDYVYETPWNHWSLEYLPDGRVRIHLQGARYYLAGNSVGELEGLTAPTRYDAGGENRWFYDPFGEELTHMAKELALNIRSVRGELILHHMWTSSDRGFALFGGEGETFRKLTNP
jgi:hypothetical protein